MKNITKKNKTSPNDSRRVRVDLANRLNLGISELLNQSYLNEYGLPIHHCNPPVIPDFIALNTEPNLFHITNKTAVAFFSYDRTFDKVNGLYNAIYYKDERLLEKYKKYYAGISFVVAPDFSMFDDIWPYENDYRLFKINVIILWFIMEIHAVVIPNAIYLSTDKLNKYLSSYKDCTIMCFSTKSHIRYSRDRSRIRDTVKYVVDNFPLKTILVYSVCGNDQTSLELFSYATSHNVKVCIVDNTLRRQNMKHRNGVIL